MISYMMTLRRLGGPFAELQPKMARLSIRTMSVSLNTRKVRLPSEFPFIGFWQEV